MYFFLKAMHLIAMVTWFAGLFYMFRLFVYHVENADKPDATTMLKIMEHKLFYYITTPGMVATLIFGFGTFFHLDLGFSVSWIWYKLVLIATLVGYHNYVGYTLKRFKRDDLFLTSKQCRLWNEFPTLILISVIFIAVYRVQIG